MRILIALLLVVLGATPAAAGPSAVIIGGTTVVVNGVPCAVAFNAKTPTDQHRLITLGSCTGSTQPVVAVAAPAGSSPSATISAGGGATITLTGTQVASIGSTVCHHSPGSGAHCGRVLAVNQTINHPGGSITGLTRTSMCFEPGDAGLPVVAGTRAQGVLIGGSGTCATGGTSYFVPIAQTLSQYGLTLHLG